MILKDGRNWEPNTDDIQIWMNAYSNIDIHAEINKMAAWCYSNPGNRKTERGIRRFINSWLSRARPVPASTSTRHTTLEQDLTDTSWAN